MIERSGIPKIELHVHVEGALSAKMARVLAARHGINLPAEIFNGEQFACTDYYDFMKAYDVVAQVVRTEQDYQDIVYDYLARSYNLGCVYVELSISPGHAAQAGLSYASMLAGVVQGIDNAHRDFGIEASIIVMFVRHHDSSSARAIETEIIKYRHPYVVGVGLAGLESSSSAKDFKEIFFNLHQIGLYCTAHAGELLGPESVWDVLKHLPIKRIGHGVRSIEDADLVAELRRKNIALEICLTSNIVMGIYKKYQEHPFLKLYEAGISLSLNSDDPTFFGTSIGKEYALAQKYFKLTKKQLIQLSYNAVQHSFALQEVKQRLLEKIFLYF